MESWTRVIVEWVNCLGIVQPSIEDLQDLKNGVFYKNLVTKLSHTDKQVATNASPGTTMTTLTTSIDEKEPVSRFIEGEYPEFGNCDECHSDIPDELYTASLLLTQCSQNGAFHRPMCSNLKHETQIHIKRFLELVLPYGKSLTREALGAAITEVGDATPNTPPSTPKPSRPLREFFNSPAARSAHSQRFMNDRNREVRRLRAELETERFEKADLIEDIQIQNEKILNLQKKLESKSQELRALRNERLKPPTPQSCRKNKRASDTEERYKRELEEFENANAALKSEIEDLQDEREQLARRIASKDRVHEVLKEKLDETEKNLEALTLQIAMKNNELLDMRMNNEQLREHIREIQRSSLGEQSFEMESIGRVRSPTCLNSSEALSSIVDIQLQEAKEESAQLKIQLDAFNRRFEALTRECEEIKSLNDVLHAKTVELAETMNKNELLQSKLNKAEATIRETEDKVKHLNDELTSAEETKIECISAKEKIEEYAKHADEKILTLQVKISDCEVRIQELNDFRTKEMEISTTLRDELAEKSSMIDVLTQRLEESVNRENTTMAYLEEANEKFAALTELAKETENKLALEREQLLQKQNELARTVSDKYILEEKMASFIQLEANMKQRIDSLRVELEESQKNLSQQIAANATLKETEKQLKDIKHELEDKLTREQNQLTLVLGEKNTLEKELALSVESTANAEKHIKNIEKALDECDKKLKEQMGCNEVLENEKIELNRTKFNLEKNLELARQELVTITGEKDALNEELSSQVSSAAELRERIKKIEKNLAKSQENLQKQLAANALLRDEQHDLEKQRTELEKELSHKREELAAIESEKETLKEETSVCIDSLKNQLAECTKKLHEQLYANTVLENEKIELNEMRFNLEKNLQMERQELSTIRAEKDTLNEELSSHVRSAAKLRERIEMIEKNLAESQENLKKQLGANALLRDEQQDLEKQRTELEKELSHKREELAAIESEKESLKEETSVCIDSLKNQLAECTRNLQEQLHANTVLENEKIELNGMRSNLEKNLEMERRELSAIRAEKDTLNEELSSHVRSAAELKERIEKIEKNLAESQENLQKQLAANAQLRDEQREREKQRMELEKELSRKQEELAAIENEKAALKEDASVCIESLKNQLAECTTKLQEQSAANTELENEKLELNGMRFNLEKNLEMERRELSTIRAEKAALNEELSSHIRSAAELKERIEEIEKNLAESQVNLQKQVAANAQLRDQQQDLEKQRTELEKELSHKREELVVIESEKETLKEETSVCIDSLKNQLAECTTKLQEQSDANTVMENEKMELNGMRINLEKNLEMERRELSTIRAEKDALNEELSSHIRSAAELRERIEEIEKNLAESQENLQKQLAANALLRDEQHDLEKQRTELQKELSYKQEELAAIVNDKETLKDESSLRIDSLSTQLVEYKNREEELQETLRISEAERLQVANDLTLVRDKCVSLENRIAEISEESNRRVEEITTLMETQLNELKRERDRLTETLNERIQSSSDLVASLEKRLFSSEKSCAEAKLEEKLKEEAIGLLRVKLEQLTKEKIESELRMNEVILNLQEVRRSQDGVLEAQVKTLKEKCLQLDETTNEIASVKAALVAKSAELENESKLAEGLQEALAVERVNVKESISRCEDLKNDMENIARVTSDLNLELKTLWDSVSSVCPEVADPRDIQSSECETFLETAKVTDAILSMEEKAKAIREVVAILIESNDKLKNKMEKLTKASGSLKLEMNALRDTVREICPELAGPTEKISSPEEGSIDDPDETDISCAIESFAKDAKSIGKAVSILSEANETLKEHLDNEKKITMSSKSEAEQRKIQLDERIATMECEREKRDNHLSSLVKRKKDLQKLVSTVVAKRDDVDDKLGTLMNKWRNLTNEVQSLLTAGSSSCDEIKHLQNKRTELDEIFAKINDRHTRGSKPLLKALCRIFVWSELKLRDANSQIAECKLVDAVVKTEFSTENELYDEEDLLKTEICNNEEIREALEGIGEKIDCFSRDLKSYETGLKVGAIKREASNEEKLQTQLEKITKERKEMKEKLDAMRTRNAKLEKNMDDLRNENKKLKSQTPTPPSIAPSTDVTEIERLEKLTENLTKEIQRLQRDNEQLLKNKTSEQNDEARLKEVHNEYGLKLEKIKQKMKTAYNEQIAKLKEEQEKTMKNKIEALRGQMEQQCKKYTDDIAKYKAHITDLSSRYWDVGEKLLAETQEKQAALQQLQQLKGQKIQQQQQVAMAEANQHLSIAQSRQKTASLDRRDFGADKTIREATTRPGYRAVEMIEEETTTYSTRRRSVQSIQAMGNAFNAEDEEGEVFDSVYLADLKEGRCAPLGPDFDRISELRSRNSMCKPHLRSSYAVETHVQPIALSEDDIKNGATGDDVFNDSLSQSLLPGQKPKKKDRTQTSYKRPGPPTPSKNGGRLSLQGNELKSPGRGILKEKNVDRRTTATPKGLKNLFGTSMSRRQDENSTSTPRARRLSNIFRKQRTERN